MYGALNSGQRCVVTLQVPFQRTIQSLGEIESSYVTEILGEVIIFADVSEKIKSLAI